MSYGFNDDKSKAIIKTTKVQPTQNIEIYPKVIASIDIPIDSFVDNLDQVIGIRGIEIIAPVSLCGFRLVKRNSIQYISLNVYNREDTTITILSYTVTVDFAYLSQD